MKKSLIAKGFTLIELLIVVTIISILAAIILPRFTDQSDAAKRSANLAQYKTIMQAIDMFYYETGAYPVVGTATGEQLARTHFVPADATLKSALEATYGTGNSWMKFMSKVPVKDQHGQAWLIGKAGTKAHVVVAGHAFPEDSNVVQGEH